MSSSFITINDDDRGFWESDGFISVYCRFLNEFLKKENSIPLNKNKWLRDFKEQMHLISIGAFPGWIHFNLENIINSNIEKEVSLHIIKEYHIYLVNKYGKSIKDKILNKYPNKIEENLGLWVGELETQDLIDFGNKLIKLIEDISNNTNDNSIENQ